MTIQIYLDKGGTLTGLSEMIERAGKEAGDGYGLLLLASEGNGFTPDKINSFLQSARLPVFGGMFPAVIYGNQVLSHATIGVTLPVASESIFIPGFSSNQIQLIDHLEGLFPDATTGQTMIIFVDGLARRIGDFIEGLFNVYGLEMNYVGGGAGSIHMCPGPCLFTNSGMHSDGAVIMLLPSNSGVGVCHGWTALRGPYQVTEAYDNTIQSLDWRPALDVYTEALGPYFEIIQGGQDFFEITHAFPFGISRLGTEQIVRAVLRIGENKSLVCAGEVEEGSFLHLMHGDTESLIQAAGLALDRAHSALPSWRKENLHLVMDCISRSMFLHNRFQEELDAINRDQGPLVGACTIGEIASCGTELLEFYNKVAVVAVLDCL